VSVNRPETPLKATGRMPNSRVLARLW
jgi:hypothetical protein